MNNIFSHIITHLNWKTEQNLLSIINKNNNLNHSSSAKQIFFLSGAEVVLNFTDDGGDTFQEPRFHASFHFMFISLYFTE